MTQLTKKIIEKSYVILACKIAAPLHFRSFSHSNLLSRVIVTNDKTSMIALGELKHWLTWVKYFGH